MNPVEQGMSQGAEATSRLLVHLLEMVHKDEEITQADLWEALEDLESVFENVAKVGLGVPYPGGKKMVKGFQSAYKKWVKGEELAPDEPFKYEEVEWDNTQWINNPTE
jgi:hypothetical protein